MANPKEKNENGLDREALTRQILETMPPHQAREALSFIDYYLNDPQQVQPTTDTSK